MTADDLRQLFKYDPETGEWTRLYKHRGKQMERVGWLCANGYHYVRIHQQTFTLHRLAWLYVHGEWPDCVIDHINQDRSDNRITNLRVCTVADNGKNTCISIKNKSGHVGVSWDSKNKKWAAAATVNKKTHFLGRFLNINEAVKVVRAFRAKNGFSERHGLPPVRKYFNSLTYSQKGNS